MGVDRTAHGGLHASCRGRLVVPGASVAAEVKVLVDFSPGIWAMSEELVKTRRRKQGMTQTASTRACGGHALVMTSLGQEWDIEPQSCLLHILILTRWGPVRLTGPFVVLPGGSHMVIVDQKTLREKPGIDIIAQLTALCTECMRATR